MNFIGKELKFIRNGDDKLLLGDYEGALFEYTRALSLNPRLSSAYAGRGYANYELRNYKGAILDCQQAVKLNAEFEISSTKSKCNQNYGKLYWIIGTSKLLLGRSDEAFIDLNSARLFGYKDAEYVIEYYHDQV